MAKLNQIVAVEKGSKSRYNDAITKAYHDAQKADLFAGLARTYVPKEDGGDQLPAETKNPQVKSVQLIERVVSDWISLIDTTATKDWTNAVAVADITVDNDVLIPAVPVTHLLFIEKQLTDLHTFITKLPRLDPAETWEYDENTAAYVTPNVETVRTKKIPRNHVKAEATDKHPAQVEVYTEDVIVGTWTTKKFSGALPAQRVQQLLTRVEKLQRAVKFAREEANMTDVVDKHIGQDLFDYVLAP